MSDRRYRAALAVAAFAVLVSLFMRYEAARFQASGAASTCSFSEEWDCDAVQSSEWGKAFGVSLSTWGAAGHFILLGWLVLARGAPGLWRAAGALAGFNLLASLAMFSIAAFVLGKFCLYCTAL